MVPAAGSNKLITLIIYCTLIGSLLGTFLALGDFDFPWVPKTNLLQSQVTLDPEQEILTEIIAVAKKNNPRLSAMELFEISTSIYQSSLEYQLDYRLILAVIEQESHFRIRAVSHKGAQGLMQLMPATGQALAGELDLKEYSLLDIDTNIKLGTYYLRKLFEQFPDPHAALTAYNRGPTGLNLFVQQTGSSKSNYSRSVLGKYPLY